MNPALVGLLLRETRGELRRLGRRMRSWKGALAGLAVIGFFGAMVALRWFMTSLVGENGRASSFFTSDRVVAFGPVVTIAMAIPSAFAGRALYFRPAEIDWLFPAPIRRRDLVLYNVLWRARISILSALWIGLLLWIPGIGYGTQVLGCALWLLFSQIASQLLSVTRVWVDERFARPTRIVLFVVLLGALAGGIAHAWSTLDVSGAEALGQLVETPLLQILTWPARPAFEVFVAPTIAARLLWALLGFGVLGAMVGLLCRLDFGLREAGLERSRKMRARIREMRGGGGALAGAPRAGFRIAPFPYLSGVGPLAWRQALELVRNPRAVVSLVFMVSLSAVAVVLFSAIGAQGISPRALAWGSVAAVVMSAITANQSLALDFRRDFDRMAVLKSWPVAALPMAVGQIVVAVAFLVAVQALAIALVALATGGLSVLAIVAIAILLVPASWVNVCLDNLIFLWMPHRTIIEDPGDVGFAGRLMAMMLLKFLALLLMTALSVGVGFAAHLALGSMGASVVAVTLVLLASCVPMTLAVAAAFRRFQL